MHLHNNLNILRAQKEKIFFNILLKTSIDILAQLFWDCTTESLYIISSIERALVIHAIYFASVRLIPLGVALFEESLSLSFSLATTVSEYVYVCTLMIQSGADERRAREDSFCWLLFSKSSIAAGRVREEKRERGIVLLLWLLRTSGEKSPLSPFTVTESMCEGSILIIIAQALFTWVYLFMAPLSQTAKIYVAHL